MLRPDIVEMRGSMGHTTKAMVDLSIRPLPLSLHQKVLATDLKMHFDVLGEFNSHLTDVHEGELVEEGRAKTYDCAMKVKWGAYLNTRQM